VDKICTPCGGVIFGGQPGDNSSGESEQYAQLVHKMMVACGQKTGYPAVVIHRLYYNRFQPFFSFIEKIMPYIGI
jgi:hypothetical protein